MRRVVMTTLFAGALLIGARGMHAQGDGGYKLVPNWAKLPPGMYFGLKDAPLPPAERDAQAAARRARGGGPAGRVEQVARVRQVVRDRRISRASRVSRSIRTITSMSSTAA